jgi:hypothetical protein
MAKLELYGEQFDTRLKHKIPQRWKVSLKSGVKGVKKLGAPQVLINIAGMNMIENLYVTYGSSAFPVTTSSSESCKVFPFLFIPS